MKDCGKEATEHTRDGGHFCEDCGKDNIIYCHDCEEAMCYSVSIYVGQDNKKRCQTCDQDFDEAWFKEHDPWKGTRK